MRNPGKLWYLSPAEPKAQRLVPPLGVVAFAGALVLAMAFTFPARNLVDRLQQSERPDALSIAYLKVWLTAEPGNSRIRAALAQQLSLSGQHSAALELLTAEPGTAPTMPPVERAILKLTLLERAYFSVDPLQEKAAPLRTQWRSAIEHTLREATKAKPGSDAQASLIKVALAFEVHDVVRSLRPTRAKPAQSQAHEEEAPHSLLAGLPSQELVEAADAYWLRLERSSSAKQRRAYLEAALRIMQAGNRLPEGLKRAERYLPTMAQDAALYRWLTQLALQAGQPQLAQRYALMMLQLGWHDDLKRYEGLVRVSSSAPQFALPRQFDAANYQLAYDVFLANSNLLDALKLAQSAIQHRPQDEAWRRKLLQVALWSGHSALALEQMAWLARRKPTLEGWTEVQKLAIALGDSQLKIEASAWLARHQPTLERVMQLAHAQEVSGDTSQAIATLQAAVQRADASLQVHLQLLAVLQRSGEESKRLAASELALERLGFHPELAIHAAVVHLAQGRDRQALIHLRRIGQFAAQNPGGVKLLDSNGEPLAFWSLYASAARRAGFIDLAITAYRYALNSNEADEQHVELLAALLERRSPDQAIALFASAYARFKEPDFARRAFELSLQSQSFEAASKLIESWPDSLKTQLLDLPSALASQALALQRAGAWKEARPMIRRWLDQQPDDTGAQSAWIWQLLGERDARSLREALVAYKAPALEGNALSSAFAAAHLSLQEPQRAVAYLLRRDDLRSDYLWQLALADALEQSGQADTAWALRQKVWRHQRPMLAERATLSEETAGLASLALRFASSDAARAMLLNFSQTAKASASGLPQEQFNELVLATLVSKGQSESARAWLLSRYATQLSQPAWARLTIALNRNDRQELESLLTDLADWLPRADRALALSRLGRDDEALGTVRALLDRNPEDAALQTRLVELLTDRPEGVEVSMQDLRLRGFSERQTSADVQLAVRSGLSAIARFTRRDHEVEDAGIAAGRAARDDFVGLGLQWRTAQHRFTALVTARDAVALRWGTQLSHQWRAPVGFIAPGLRLRNTFEWRQPADETVALRVLGERNALLSQVDWQLDDRTSVSAQLGFSTLRLQQGVAVATGRVFGAGLRYELTKAIPGIKALASVRSASYDPRDAGSALTPVGATEFALGLQIGEPIDLRPSAGWLGRWRPFALLSGIENSVVGTTYRWALGAQGSVLGPDVLALSLSRQGATSQQAGAVQSLTLNYRWITQ
jgi:hypothetical protein